MSLFCRNLEPAADQTRFLEWHESEGQIPPNSRPWKPYPAIHKPFSPSTWTTDDAGQDDIADPMPLCLPECLATTRVSRQHLCSAQTRKVPHDSATRYTQYEDTRCWGVRTSSLAARLRGMWDASTQLTLIRKHFTSLPSSTMPFLPATDSLIRRTALYTVP